MHDARKDVLGLVDRDVQTRGTARAPRAADPARVSARGSFGDRYAHVYRPVAAVRAPFTMQMAAQRAESMVWWQGMSRAAAVALQQMPDAADQGEEFLALAFCRVAAAVQRALSELPVRHEGARWVRSVPAPG